MGTVVMHNVVSVDGYIADEADGPTDCQHLLEAPFPKGVKFLSVYSKTDGIVVIRGDRVLHLRYRVRR